MRRKFSASVRKMPTNESITYSLFDCDGDGDLDLRRQDPTVVPVNAAVPVEQMVAENVEALDFVYLDEDESVATKRKIRPGRMNPQVIEILEGLTPGEKVITSSYENFGDNDKLILK